LTGTSLLAISQTVAGQLAEWSIYGFVNLQTATFLKLHLRANIESKFFFSHFSTLNACESSHPCVDQFTTTDHKLVCQQTVQLAMSHYYLHKCCKTITTSGFVLCDGSSYLQYL